MPARLIAAFGLLLSLTPLALPQTASNPDRGTLRATIEAYPEADKRRLLDFLDAARATADQAVKFVAEGKSAALYTLMISAFKSQVTVSGFEDAMSDIEDREGKIVSYEYRNQALLYGTQNNTARTPPQQISQVWYAVKTTKITGDGVFLMVKTVAEGNKQVVVSVSFPSYENHIPDWLKKPAKTP